MTEDEYGLKLKKLMAMVPDFDGIDARLLSYCRPIWEGSLLLAVARNQRDCEALKTLAKTGDIIFEPQNFPGPVVLARNFGVSIGQEEIEVLGKKYLLQYSKKAPSDPIIFVVKI